jgi:salicylate hydroxylase
MPATGRSYYIAGAGIAGLTLALTLAKFGASVIVLERSPVLSEFGAGLQIGPNARRILDRLGLDEALQGCSLEPTGLDVYPYRRPRPLATYKLGDAMRQRFGAAYAVMRRADLAETLYKACRRFANIDIRFGVPNWTVESRADGVTVTYEEADGQSRTGRGHAFIGADGVHSRTRTELIGGPAARYGGRIAWRTLLPFESMEGQIAMDRASVLFGPGYHAICYPLPHRRQVNIALFASQRQPDGRLGTRPLPGSSKSHGPRFDALLAAAGDSWTPWPLYTVRTPHWYKGNIGLVGDAAHAMVPFQAQGAAMGIEDAAVLAPLLISEASAETAFARYETQRRHRVTRIAKASATNGRIFHMPWPLTLARDMVIFLDGKRPHLQRWTWIYGYDAHPGSAPEMARKAAREAPLVEP